MINPDSLSDAELVACVTELVARAAAHMRNQDKDEWFGLNIECYGYTNSGSSIEIKHQAMLGSSNTTKSVTGDLIRSAVNVNQMRYMDKCTPTVHVSLALPAPATDEAEFVEVHEDDMPV
jgi:hypothetical protein